MRQLTGSKQVLVRGGFSDHETYRDGYYMAATGNLDAPDYMPQGSVRVHDTMKPCPTQSTAHREWDYGLPLGVCHVGPEAAPNVMNA